MKTKLILILCILSFGVLNAQNLSIADLTNICGKSTYEQVATILTQKGWAFYESKTGRWFDGSIYRCTIWSHSRDEWEGDKAQAWFHIYCYNNKVCAINYQMFENVQYARMESQMAGAGFKFQKTEYHDNSPIMSYSNNLFYLTIRNSRDDVANYGNRYTFDLIKKGSQADTKNGKKAEDSWWGKVEYTLVDGEKHGQQKVYFPNGKLKKVTTFVHGIETGSYKEYDKEGRLTAEGQVKNGDFTGKVKYYENGKLVKDGIVGINGFTGWQKFYEDDVLIGEINIKDGEIHGECKSYYPNGKLKEKITAIHGEKNGPAKYWDEDGRLIFEGTLSPSTNSGYDDLFEDVAVEASEDNKYVASGTKAEDELEVVEAVEENEFVATGHIWQYDDNGKIEFEWYLKDGKKHGVSKEFEDGKLISEKTYENGVETGPYKSYYGNGQIELDIVLKDGQPEGVYKKYLENGTLVSDGTMHNGKFTGIKKIYYDGDTSIALIFNLKEDLFHGHITAFDEKGEIVKEGDFIEGKGNFVMKDSMNRTICIEPIINNLEHGDEIHYTYNTDNSVAEIAITEYERGEETGNLQIISRDTLVEVSENGNLLTFYVTEDSSPTENYHSKTWIKMHAISLKNGKKNGIEWICYPQEDYYDYVECNYKDGVREGDYRVYTNIRNDFKSAKLKYSFRYIAGKPHGNYYNYGKDSTFISKKFDHGQITYCMMPINMEAVGDNVLFQFKFEKLDFPRNHWKKTVYYNDSIVEQTLHFVMEYPYTPLTPWSTPQDYCNDTYSPELFCFPVVDVCNEFTYPDGDYHCAYQDGTKDIKGQYYKQDKIGDWTILYPEQSIKQVISYGTNSEPLSEMFYTLSGQLFSGEFVEDLSDETYMICPIKKGIRHGKAKIYSKATRMIIEKKRY